MASELQWPDRLLTDAAVRLTASGDPASAEALLSFSELTLRYGSSWWDGHDDYVYDVDILVVRAGLVPGAAGA